MELELQPAARLLRDALLERIERNPSYSLRSFARQLGVSHTYLSLVMNGKKPLSLRKTLEFSSMIGLEESQSKELLKFSVKRPEPRRRAKTDNDFHVLEIDRFKLLSQWYHLAILDLTLLSTFKPNIRWISRRLSINPQQTKAAVERLQRMGLLKIEGKRWIKSNARLTVPTRKPEESVREFHSQMIAKAQEALRSSEFKRRDITGTTIAVNPAKLAGAKIKVEKFSKSLLDYLSDGDCTELYQLNVQLFPLTQEDKSK